MVNCYYPIRRKQQPLEMYKKQYVRGNNKIIHRIIKSYFLHLTSEIIKCKGKIPVMVTCYES